MAPNFFLSILFLILDHILFILFSYLKCRILNIYNIFNGFNYLIEAWF